MQFRNQKEETPFFHYAARFRELVPGEVTARLGNVKWDGKEFYVNLLGKEYAVSHPECVIRTPEGAEPSRTVQTFLLRCLLEGQEVPFQGRWMTFREMPWGEVYAKTYSGRVLTRAAFAFGTRLDDFRTACERQGARPLNHGDAGYQFDVFGDYRMQLLVWEGDEDFPPGAQILYSDNFAAGFTAEDRVVAAELLIGTIKSVM